MSKNGLLTSSSRPRLKEREDLGRADLGLPENFLKDNKIAKEDLY